VADVMLQNGRLKIGGLLTVSYVNELPAISVRPGVMGDTSQLRQILVAADLFQFVTGC
jgi:hypothetical protein